MSGFDCEDLFRESGLRRFLGEFGIAPNEGLGQHFLFDRGTLEAIAEAAGSGGTVVEIGAGVGSLTCLLKGSFEETYAVELDGKFEEPFGVVNPEEDVRFVREDILELDFSSIPGLEGDERGKLVGNIPYNITGKVLQRAVSARGHFSRAVFTVQKEVAERILAEPGSKNCGRISYHVRAYGEVERLLEVPPGKFYPPPEVDSTVIALDLDREGEFEVEEGRFANLLRGVFLHRRKTVRNGLLVSPEFSLAREEVDSLLEAAGVDSGKRPEELALEDFGRLAESLREMEID